MTNEEAVLRALATQGGGQAAQPCTGVDSDGVCCSRHAWNGRDTKLVAGVADPQRALAWRKHFAAEGAHLCVECFCARVSAIEAATQKAFGRGFRFPTSARTLQLRAERQKAYRREYAAEQRARRSSR